MLRPLQTLLFLPLLGLHVSARPVKDQTPSTTSNKIFGVNIGNWLVFEPWMAEQEWSDMGGEKCSGDCSGCIRTEWALTQSLGDRADSVFNQHWESWFTQSDVQTLSRAGINTARIPLGFWIVEDLVDPTSEFYAKGGMLQLKRGLRMLKSVGMQAILDHHALPGVAAKNQLFAGKCTNSPQFYQTSNYQRALTWTAVMTAMTHLDPDFDSVFSIEAINEVLQDASQTPGYDTFQKNFVQVVRGMELALGIAVPGKKAIALQPSHNNLKTTIPQASKAGWTPAASQALKDSLPILQRYATKYDVPAILNYPPSKRNSIVTNFMDSSWQRNSGPNPADAAMGPQSYDSHIYYAFGGTSSNEDAYMKSICNRNPALTDAKSNNSPVVVGEWSLATQFSASDDFIKKFADAQKMAYSKGGGWIFWNFKIEKSNATGNAARQWSYIEGLKRGYLTQDPSALNNPNACDSYN